MKEYTVTLRVTVHDATALREHSAMIATLDNGLSPEEWAEMRRDHPTGPIAADLLMVLDPGESPPGCSIESGEATAAAY